MSQVRGNFDGPRRLPERPNLRHLRDQARDLVRGGQIERLSEALQAIAQIYGFRTWVALKRHVDWSDRLWADLDKLGWLPAREHERVRASGNVDLSNVKVAAVEHPNPKIRRVCINILDHLGEADVGPVLLVTLRDPVPKNRRAAIHALTCTRCKPNGLDCDPTADLQNVALSDPHPRVRAAAVSSLPVELIVSRSLVDPEVEVRVEALIALLVRGTPEAIDAVKGTFAGSPGIVRSAIRKAPKHRGAVRAMDRWVRQQLGERWASDDGN